MKKQIYVAPSIMVEEVRIEKGFATSSVTTTSQESADFAGGEDDWFNE